MRFNLYHVCAMAAVFAVGSKAITLKQTNDDNELAECYADEYADLCDWDGDQFAEEDCEQEDVDLAETDDCQDEEDLAQFENCDDDLVDLAEVQDDIEGDEFAEVEGKASTPCHAKDYEEGVKAHVNGAMWNQEAKNKLKGKDLSGVLKPYNKGLGDKKKAEEAKKGKDGKDGKKAEEEKKGEEEKKKDCKDGLCPKAQAIIDHAKHKAYKSTLESRIVDNLKRQLALKTIATTKAAAMRQRLCDAARADCAWRIG